LRWKGVPSDDAATIHARPARWPIVRGGAPFGNLLSVQLDDSTARVLHLTPAGTREVAVLESRGFAPVVAGAPGRPVAISIIASGPPPGRRVQVGLFDLRCGLAAEPAPSLR
jgi:hypothetical protein